MEIFEPICDKCAQLSLSALRKCPSVSLRDNDDGLNKKQWSCSLTLNPPIVLTVANIMSNRNQCVICSLVRTHLKSPPTPAEHYIEVYKCEDKKGLESLCLSFFETKRPDLIITLFADEGTFASKHVPFRPIAPRDSDKSMQDIQDWIATCNESHPRCRYSLSGVKMNHKAVVPTRIIDVGKESLEEVRLVVSNQMARKYVALSHRWGGSSHYCTTVSNLEQHKIAIDVTGFPKTIQDAIFIVRRLGLRYLWVDSLCIVQDDKTDWLREAGRMAAVYEGAYLTIAASASEDGSGGCYVDRCPQELVRVPCQKDDAAAGHMYFGVVDKKAAEKMLRGPLNSRAWVLQEHLFARRTVHFAADQIYWECDKYIMGQDQQSCRSTLELDFPTRAFLYCILGDFLGKDRMPHLVKDPPQALFSRADYYSWWVNTIRYYSKCGITKSSDKLPALLSLSTELAKLTGDEYHEGHWRPPAGDLLFISTLLWHADDRTYLTKPSLFRAPSWSWAALDGPLDFADIHNQCLSHLFTPEKTDLQVLKVLPFEPLGLPSRKALLLSGVLIPASRSSDVSEPQLGVHDDCMACDKALHQVCSRVVGEDGNEIYGAFAFDLADVQLSEFWLLAAFSRWVKSTRPAPVHYVLLVSEVPNQRAPRTVFERVGVGHVEDARMVYGRSRQFVTLI